MKKPLSKLLFFVTFLFILAAFTVFIAFRMKKPVAIDADFQELARKLEEQGLTENMIPGTPLELKRRFGLLEDAYLKVLYYEPVTYMNVEEILVVEIRSEAEGDEVRESIGRALETQMKLFENYGVDQYGYLKDSVIYRNERYVLYAAGAHTPEAVREIRSVIER
jgi:hypothetical protein